MLNDIVGLLQTGIQDIYAIDGNDSVADFQSSLTVSGATRSNIGHNQWPSLWLLVAEAAAHRESVRAVLLFQLYVNCLGPDGMVRMNRPRRQIVLELEAKAVARILDQVNDFFVLEALRFDAVYRNDHVADLEFVWAMGYASGFQVADSGPAVLVSAARDCEAELGVVGAR